MEQSKFILIANAVPIIIILVMALLLCFASHFKGKSSYMAILILCTTLPDFAYNVCDLLNWHETALFIAPIAYSVNLTLMPLMLILAYRTFNRLYSFQYIRLLHFLPAIAYAVFTAIYISSIPHYKFENSSIEETLIFNSPLPPINLAILSAQLIVYAYVIFTYMRRVRRYIYNNLSHAQLSEVVWAPRFITLIGIMVITAIIGSLFNPLEGFRLFYLISVIAMAYLLYCELSISFERKKENAALSISLSRKDMAKYDSDASGEHTRHHSENHEEKIEQLRNYAARIEEYLQNTEAYMNPNLSLKDVAAQTGISAKNLSKSINMVLGKTFFDLINGCRIEKSKQLLMAKKRDGLTLDTIAEKCGFNSRFTLNAAFKKATGLTTTQWLKKSKTL